MTRTILLTALLATAATGTAFAGCDDWPGSDTYMTVLPHVDPDEPTKVEVTIHNPSPFYAGYVLTLVTHELAPAWTSCGLGVDLNKALPGQVMANCGLQTLPSGGTDVVVIDLSHYTEAATRIEVFYQSTEAGVVEMDFGREDAAGALDKASHFALERNGCR